MATTNYKVLIFICGLLLLQGCKKDAPSPTVNTTPGSKSGVYVACEGQFTVGNASLYLYQPQKDSVFGDLYQAANGQGAGDVLQSLAFIDGQVLLAVNNSNKLLAIGGDNLKLTSSLTLPYPRYILQITDSIAWVTSLYSKKVFIIIVPALRMSDSITLPAQNTEAMVKYNDEVFVAGWDTSKNEIYRINSATHQIAQSISIAGYAPHDLLLDKEQMLWVLSGNQTKGKRAYWTRINPATGTILATLAFPEAAEPIKPIFNATLDTLYYIEANYYGGTDNNGIYRMGIHEAEVPADPFIPAKSLQYFWALGMDPATGNVYVGDPKGFNQKGSVSIYDHNGGFLKSFSVGVGPSQFYFR